MPCGSKKLSNAEHVSMEMQKGKRFSLRNLHENGKLSKEENYDGPGVCISNDLLLEYSIVLNK